MVIKCKIDTIAYYTNYMLVLTANTQHECVSKNTGRYTSPLHTDTTWDLTFLWW